MAKPPKAPDDPPHQPIVITDEQVVQKLKPPDPVLGLQGKGTTTGKAGKKGTGKNKAK